MPLDAGTKLGPYEIVSPLGAGGMGEVYRARDTKLGREVAIKVLPADVASSPERLQRFEREATTVAALNHPNIVTIFGIEESEGHRFIAMELVEGETLGRMIAPGGMTLAQIFDIAIPLADALAAAHDKGIVHRDLKPANVMVTKEGRVKVLDFGLAKLTATGQGGSSPDDVTMPAPLTGRGMIIGTVPYMSPEQLQGESVDHRTDLFSLGIMLYEMATEQRPFQGKNSATITSSILRDNPRPLHGFNGVLPRHLGRIIEHCLEKNAEERFQSAKDIRNELRALRKEVDSGSDLSEPVSVTTTVAQPPSSTSSLPSGSAMSAPTRRGEFWIGVSIIAIILVGGFWFMRSGDQWNTSPTKAEQGVTAPTIDSIAVLPLRNISGDSTQEYFVDAMTGAITDDLARIGALAVIGARTMMRYKGSELSLPQIAREVGAKAFVTGSAVQDGDRIRISVQLIEASTQRQLWSEQFDRDKRDILSVQSEVARAVARGIKGKLTPSEKDSLASAPEVIWQAYDTYIRGLELVRQATRASCLKAIDLFEEALTVDPKFARALAAKASAYDVLASTHLPPKDTLPELERAARAALDLDGGLAEAHIVLAEYKKQWEWDWDGARRSIEEALASGGMRSSAHVAKAKWLAVMNRPEEAMAQLDLAQELDPSTRYSDGDFGAVSFMARRYERTIRDNEAALAFDPDFWQAHKWIGLAKSQRGRSDEAISHLRRAVELSKSPQTAAMLGAVLAVAGQVVEARAIRKRLKERKNIEYVCPYEVATISIGLNEFDQAFEEIVEACDDRASCVPWLQVDPRLDPIRDDARFDQILVRIGFEPSRAPLAIAKSRGGKTILAIVPFKDHSPKPEDWLAFGLADAISTRLGRVNPSRLGILGPETTTYYAQLGKSIQDLRKDLNVDFVLRGSIQVIGNDVRITANLVHADDLTRIWSDEFKGTMDDSFALQTMVADKIIAGLPFELTGEERVRSRNRYTANPKAELAYMQGRFFASVGSAQKLSRAVSYFKQAIEIDPDYALAYCGLVDAKCVLATWGTLQTSQIRSEMEDTVARALALDDTLVEAHVSKGIVAMYLNWDWPEAEVAFKRAVQLNPNLADTYLEYGHLLVFIGRYDEAKQRFEQAIDLNPLSSSHLSGLGMLYAGLGKLSEAETLLQRAYRFNKENVDASFWLADVRQKQGRFDEAVGIMELAVSSMDSSAEQPELARLCFLGNAYAMAGRMDDARKQLAEMHKTKGEAPGHHMWFGEMHAALGEKDEAFRRLDQALAAREAWLPHIRFDPGLIHIRSDPRFAELHRKMGLGHVDLSYASKSVSTASD